MSCRLRHTPHCNPFYVTVFITGRPAINELRQSTAQSMMMMILLCTKQVNKIIKINNNKIAWQCNMLNNAYMQAQYKRRSKHGYYKHEDKQRLILRTWRT